MDRYNDYNFVIYNMWFHTMLNETTVYNQYFVYYDVITTNDVCVL